MVRAILAFLAVGLLLQAPLLGEVHELKAKKIKVNKKNAGILPEVELRPQSQFAERKNEPNYRSDYAKRFTAAFGNGEGFTLAMAVDEKQGTGKGFDLIYIDLEGDGDLAKGKKFVGKTANRGYSYEDTDFPTFEVQVPNGDGSSPYPVKARFSTMKNNPNEASLYLTPLCVMEGAITFGEKKKKIMVFDTNCNGVFGEAGTLKGATVSGDKIWIGSGSPKVENAFVEAIPLGKYYLFEDSYYELSITDSSKVEIKKADVALGKIKVNNPGFLLELVQGDNVLYAGNEKGTELAVPVGKWKVNNASFRRRYKGDIWELQGRAGTFREQFNVREDEATEIKVGPPLKVMINGSSRMVGNGMQASFRFSLAGSAGETYQYLLKGGKKIDLPDIKIKSPKGKVVQEGGFEYG
jgi:hypothetical protein